jgi:hypothetical protein
MHITRITICVIFINLKEFEGLNVGLCKQFIELSRWVNSGILRILLDFWTQLDINLVCN